MSLERKPTHPLTTHLSPLRQGHIDGTVFASNPSLTAVAKALATYEGALELRDVAVLSIGGPPAPQLTLPRSADWGVVQWLPWLMSLLFDSSIESTHTNVALLLGSRYLRVTPGAAPHVPLHLNTRWGWERQ